MKKIKILLLFLLYIIIGIIFQTTAYTLTDNDKIMLGNIYVKIEKIINENPAKAKDILHKIEKVKIKFIEKENIYYILDNISEYIKLKLDILDKESKLFNNYQIEDYDLEDKDNSSIITGANFILNGIQYEILSAKILNKIGYKNSFSDYKFPKNGQFVLIEFNYKNISNNYGYPAKFTILNGENQYTEDITVGIYGEYQIGYKNNNSKLLIGAKRKMYIGFDTDKNLSGAKLIVQSLYGKEQAILDISNIKLSNIIIEENPNYKVITGTNFEFEGIQYEILEAYIFDKLGSFPPENGQNVLLEYNYKNISSNYGYPAKFMILNGENQYKENIFIEGDGSLYMGYGNDNSKLLIGAKRTRYLGFDTHKNLSGTKLIVTNKLEEDKQIVLNFSNIKTVRPSDINKNEKIDGLMKNLETSTKNIFITGTNFLLSGIQYDILGIKIFDKIGNKDNYSDYKYAKNGQFVFIELNYKNNSSNYGYPALFSIQNGENIYEKNRTAQIYGEFQMGYKNIEDKLQIGNNRKIYIGFDTSKNLSGAKLLIRNGFLNEQVIINISNIKTTTENTNIQSLFKGLTGNKINSTTTTTSSDLLKGLFTDKEGFSCGTKNKCEEMNNCEEANYYFKNCGLNSLDGDNDGIPCTKLCK